MVVQQLYLLFLLQCIACCDMQLPPVTLSRMKLGPLAAVHTIQLHKAHGIHQGFSCTLPRQHHEISSVAMSYDVLSNPWGTRKSFITGMNMNVEHSLLQAFNACVARAHRIPHSSIKWQVRLEELQHMAQYCAVLHCDELRHISPGFWITFERFQGHREVIIVADYVDVPDRSRSLHAYRTIRHGTEA